MLTYEFILSSPSQQALVASLVNAGILVATEGGYTVQYPNIFSPQSTALDGSTSAFIRLVVEDQTTLDTILAKIPVELINMVGKHITLVAGSISPTVESYDMGSVEYALAVLDRLVDWEAAITTLSTDPTATAAMRKLPVRWKRTTYVTLDETWITRIINQMRTSLGWTVAQRNQFLNQLKNRASIEQASE